MSDREFWTWCAMAVAVIVGSVFVVGCYAIVSYYLGNW